jgi:hypothetical protein
MQYDCVNIIIYILLVPIRRAVSPTERWVERDTGLEVEERRKCI